MNKMFMYIKKLNFNFCISKAVILCSTFMCKLYSFFLSDFSVNERMATDVLLKKKAVINIF